MPAWTALGWKSSTRVASSRGARFSTAVRRRPRGRARRGRPPAARRPLLIRRRGIARAIGACRAAHARSPLTDEHPSPRAPRLHRDPEGQPQQVRVRRGHRPGGPRPLPLLVDGLPDRLRLPDGPPRPRRRPARRDGLRLGADLPRLRDPGEADRAVQDAATRRARTTRSSASRPTTRAGTTPRSLEDIPEQLQQRDHALLLGLQAARGQGGRGRRLALARGGARGDRRRPALQMRARRPARAS